MVCIEFQFYMKNTSSNEYKLNIEYKFIEYQFDLNLNQKFVLNCFEFEWFVLNFYSPCQIKIKIQNKPLHKNFWRLKKMTTPGDIHKGCRKFEKKQERTDSEIREGKERTNEMSRPKAKCGP